MTRYFTTRRAAVRFVEEHLHDPGNSALTMTIERDGSEGYYVTIVTDTLSADTEKNTQIGTKAQRNT